MTQHEQSKHFCMKCGYQLVGPPLPTRCSECGYPIVYQARWREGELHLAGPTIVWPVAKRFVLATALLFFSVVVSILCYSDVLLQMKLVGFSTARWEACHNFQLEKDRASKHISCCLEFQRASTHHESVHQYLWQVPRLVWRPCVAIHQVAHD